MRSAERAAAKRSAMLLPTWLCVVESCCYLRLGNKFCQGYIQMWATKGHCSQTLNAKYTLQIIPAYQVIPENLPRLCNYESLLGQSLLMLVCRVAIPRHKLQEDV